MITQDRGGVWLLCSSHAHGAEWGLLPSIAIHSRLHTNFRSLVGHPEDQYTQNFQKLNCELTAVISNPQYRAAICISSVSTPSHLSRNYHQFQAFSFGRLCFCASITTATGKLFSWIFVTFYYKKYSSFFLHVQFFRGFFICMCIISTLAKHKV